MISYAITNKKVCEDWLHDVCKTLKIYLNILNCYSILLQLNWLMMLQSHVLKNDILILKTCDTRIVNRGCIVFGLILNARCSTSHGWKNWLFWERIKIISKNISAEESSVFFSISLVIPSSLSTLSLTHLGSISPTCLPKTFTCKDPKSTKRLSSHQCLFALLGSSLVKAACKMLVKSTHGVNFISFLLAAVATVDLSQFY